ncbi:MAG: hypothetical protein GXO22_08290 [Aquificae bacterium]|nr:hypothetical protein [Aquificota bacterium]
MRQFAFSESELGFDRTINNLDELCDLFGINKKDFKEKLLKSNIKLLELNQKEKAVLYIYVLFCEPEKFFTIIDKYSIKFESSSIISQIYILVDLYCADEISLDFVGVFRRKRGTWTKKCEELRYLLKKRNVSL